MLDELTAENLGLIGVADVRLAPGLTVVTGETGTGKTLLLGALRLLRGDQARKGMIGPSGESCTVSARFVEGTDERILRRTVTPSRSRAYIDGAAATASDLAEVLAERVSIVGQHDQLTITSTRGVRALVDRRLDDAGGSALERYHLAWSAWTAVRDEASQLGDLRMLERERDTLAYQLAEISAVGIDPEHDEGLRDRVIALRNIDAVIEGAHEAVRSLGAEGSEAFLEQAARALRAAARFDASAAPLADRAEQLAELANDLSSDVARHATSIEGRPGELAELEDRLHLLGDLQRKYGDTIDDVMTFAKNAEGELARLDQRIVGASSIHERLDLARTELDAAGTELRDARAAAATRLAADARRHLLELGFSDPVLEVIVEPADPSGRGADVATVRFASTSELAPGPVSAIASGGELSRLVLALTLASGAGSATTLAFDEIDAGIGGTTALAMGAKLRALAADRQVVCVSHLPQVAAYADLHLRVTRSGAVAEVTVLGEDERVAELTRMLSGIEGSEPASGAARELLDHARSA